MTIRVAISNSGRIIHDGNSGIIAASTEVVSMVKMTLADPRVRTTVKLYVPSVKFVNRKLYCAIYAVILNVVFWEVLGVHV